MKLLYEYKVALVILFTVIISGCGVGYSVITHKNVVQEIESYNWTKKSFKNQKKHGGPKGYGEPHSVDGTEKNEIWIYHRGKKKRKLIVFLGIPIPISLKPLESEVKIYFNGNRAIRMERINGTRHDKGFGFVCAPKFVESGWECKGSLGGSDQ